MDKQRLVLIEVRYLIYEYFVFLFRKGVNVDANEIFNV